MERVVNKARSHDEAKAWDIRQQVSMSPQERIPPQERIRASRELRKRVYTGPVRDVRECHRKS